MVVNAGRRQLHWLAGRVRLKVGGKKRAVAQPDPVNDAVVVPEHDRLAAGWRRVWRKRSVAGLGRNRDGKRRLAAGPG
jgi:hypothetical protein